jgi:hypothetical protein
LEALFIGIDGPISDSPVFGDVSPQFVRSVLVKVIGPAGEFLFGRDRLQTAAAAEWRTEIGWPIFQA